MILLTLSNLLQFLFYDGFEPNRRTDVFPLKRLVNISMLDKEIKRMKQHIQCVSVSKDISFHTIMRI